MKKIVVLFLLFTLQSNAQSLFAYKDFNNFFKGCINGYTLQLDHQPIIELSLGDNLVVYKNFQNDLKLYDGKKIRLLTSQIAEYKNSDNICAWNIGKLLYFYENQKVNYVTAFGGNYWVSDSLFVYQDEQMNTLNVYYKGEKIELLQSSSIIWAPEFVSDNIVVYRDNGDILKCFWQGEIYEIGPMNSNNSYTFSGGMDVFAFNDPQSQTFIVFDKGEFIEIESMYVNNIKAARGFVMYEDRNRNLKIFQDNKVTEVASFFQNWDAKDDIPFWVEANTAYTWLNGEKKIVSPFNLTDFSIKNDVIAFRNPMSGVSYYCNGITKEVSNITNTEFIVNGHGVMITLQNKSVIIAENDKIIRD
jgi:hypothetical protein